MSSFKGAAETEPCKVTLVKELVLKVIGIEVVSVTWILPDGSEAPEAEEIVKRGSHLSVVR